MSFRDLPEAVFHRILSHLQLRQLGVMSQVCHQFNKYTISFLDTTCSIPVLFPSFKVTMSGEAMSKFFISGSEDQFSVDITKATSNFGTLGIFLKKLTCLLPTTERVILSIKLMSRLSPCTAMSPSSHMMSLCGVFLHQIVRGWADQEVVTAARLVFLKFNSGEEGGCVNSILAPGYHLGSRPDVEMHVRNFLASVFYKEAAFGQEGLWLETLLHQSGSMVDTSVMSKVLLLISSPAKEEEWHFGVQWADHVEAIPATLAVASSRYNFLVCLLNTMKNSEHGFMIPSILYSIFPTPSPWLPENVGSVLLLLGHETCYLYIQYLVSRVVNRSGVCTNCFKDISTAIVGLALMTARFRWSFAPVLARLEEAVMIVSCEKREEMLRAIWKGLAEEVRDIREAVGEDWATESSLHLFKVIRLIGQKLTEKAFMHLQSVAVESAVSIEE